MSPNSPSARNPKADSQKLLFYAVVLHCRKVLAASTVAETVLGGYWATSPAAAEETARKVYAHSTRLDGCFRVVDQVQLQGHDLLAGFHEAADVAGYYLELKKNRPKASARRAAGAANDARGAIAVSDALNVSFAR